MHSRDARARGVQSVILFYSPVLFGGGRDASGDARVSLLLLLLAPARMHPMLAAAAAAASRVTFHTSISALHAVVHVSRQHQLPLITHSPHLGSPFSYLCCDAAAGFLSSCALLEGLFLFWSLIDTKLQGRRSYKP